MYKGCSVDSGYYVLWVKKDDGSWTEFDDETFISRIEEDVLVFKGGGDYYMFYILCYKVCKI